MAKLRFDISISLDGFLAGPDPDGENPLGQDGEKLHEWVFATQSWRATHGEEGGEAGVDSQIADEHFKDAGATIMGRRMFSGEGGPWGDDPFQGWWGDDPPYHMPVFVLTNHPREPLTLSDTTFTFVTDGVHSALEQANEAARGKDVTISGGGNVVQQYLEAGLVDEFQVHVAPVLLGSGTRLLDGVAADLEITRVVESPAATHLTYRVRR